MTTPSKKQYVRDLEYELARYRQAERKKRPWTIADWLTTLLIIGMLAALAIAVAPRAIELYLWYQAGMPVGEAQQPAPTTAPVQRPTYQQQQPAQPQTQPVQQPLPTAVVPEPTVPAVEGVKINAHTLPPLPTAQPIVIAPAEPAQTSVDVDGSLHMGWDGITAEGSASVVHPVPTAVIEFKANNAPATVEGVKKNRRSLK